MALSEPGELLRGRGVPPAGAAALWVLAGGAAYGAAMGGLGGRGVAMLASAVKLPLLLAGAALLTAPFFVVVCLLAGLRGEVLPALRGVVAGQATTALALLSLAPLTILVYVSGVRYSDALLWNALVLTLAASAGQVTLNRHARPLVRRHPRFRLARWSWLALVLFVVAKLGWVLRPFVGDPDLPFTWRREGWDEDPFANLFWAAASLVVRAWRGVVGG